MVNTEIRLIIFFGTLHSKGYIFPFLLCFPPLFFSQLFARPPQTAILLCCFSFSWGWSCSLSPDNVTNTLFQKHKRRLYTWTSPDGQHWDQTNYIPCSQRWRSSIQSAKTRLAANCGSDHELLIAKFRLKLKKVGKTTRPFRYDLNRILNDYTVEVRNRFKGLDLIDRVLDELWLVSLHN